MQISRPFSSNSFRTGLLRAGGSSITLISLSPTKDILSVLGIGVAEMVRRSTFALKFFIYSFCITPNRCSSSTAKRPKSL